MAIRLSLLEPKNQILMYICTYMYVLSIALFLHSTYITHSNSYVPNVFVEMDLSWTYFSKTRNQTSPRSC